MSPVDQELRQRIAIGLYERGMFRTWFRDRPEGWTLVSGLWSPVYLQLRELASHPDLLRDVGVALAGILEEELPDADALVGIAYGGIPIAVAASLASGVPAVMTRKLEAGGGDELAKYGQHASVEGEIPENSRLVLVDDLVTRFDSKLVGAEQVEQEAARRGLEGVGCRDVLVVVDREQGGEEAAQEHGFSLRSVLRLQSEGLDALRERLAPVEYDMVKAYFEDPAAFQDPGEQRRLAAMANDSHRGGERG